ncbi:MAG: lysine 2,3-aminomutase [Kiritimatiellae bacterium]|nr:lysine 2,3-aminomutase [Kiritimatiellia bacterium]
MRNYREIELWKDVTEKQWRDWHWQIRNRITDVATLRQVVELDDAEADQIGKVLGTLRMAISPYYATLMDPADRGCPIRLQAVPSGLELAQHEEDMRDPLHEDGDSPTPGLTHRYPDRVLFLVTDQCTMYCRHCTRRRLAGVTDQPRPASDIDAAIEYIRSTTDVRDVLISGGDPLTLADAVLEDILKRLRAIEHVEIIRIGTRTPVVLPYRITESLCEMLQRYHPLYVNTHFNTPAEVTSESRQACDRLSRAGIPLGNQSVLLHGINDCVEVMRALVHELLKLRVRPYYIYQCDLTAGIEHFRTSIGKGIEIIECLRGHTSGLAVPTFVIDAPGGGGKIPVGPQYLISRSSTQTILRNYEGYSCVYTEPREYRDPCGTCSKIKSCSRSRPLIGLEKLFRGGFVSLHARHAARDERRRDREWHA